MFSLQLANISQVFSTKSLVLQLGDDSVKLQYMCFSNSTILSVMCFKL